MRVCLLCEYFYPDSAGGPGAVFSSLARQLKDAYPELDIEVITSKNTYRGQSLALPTYENWQGIKIFRLRTPKSNRASTLQRLVLGGVFTLAALGKMLLRRRYDLVLLVTNPPSLPMAALAYKRLRRTPYVYTIYDLYPDVATSLNVLSPASLPARVLRRLQARWLKSSARTIALGRCMRDYLRENYGLDESKIEVITNWADPGKIAPQGKNTRFRAAHDLRGTVVLYAGNFGQYQNFDNILDAARLLQGTQPDITFVCVGEGARRDHVARRVAEENISNVRLFSMVPQEEFADLLASADISLVTLEPGMEGLGVPSKFYNILASGRPTVAILGPQSEVARVLTEADCGVQVEQDNSARLAQVLGEMAAAPATLTRMGENARRVFLQNHTIQRCGEQYYELFLKLSERTLSKSHEELAPAKK